MPARRAPLVLLVVLALGMFVPSVATADSGGSAGGPDENRDIATPGPVPADSRPVQTLAATEAAADSGVTIFAAAAARNPIDDFRYDELVLEGTAREVCAGRLLTGSGWTFNEIVSRFGGTAGTMYFCRERWDTANDPACNGQLANPVTSPNFYSTCWSNHARGRAIDVMVGTVGRRLQHVARAVHRQLAARPRRPGQRQRQRPQARHPADPVRRPLLEQRRRPRHRLVGRDAPVRHRPPRPRPPRPDDQRRQRQRVLLGARTAWSRRSSTPRCSGTATRRWRQAVSWWNLVATDEEGLAVPASTTRASSATSTATGSQDETSSGTTRPGTGSLQNWNERRLAQRPDRHVVSRLRRDRRRRLGCRRPARRHDPLGPRHRQLRRPVVVRTTRRRYRGRWHVGRAATTAHRRRPRRQRPSSTTSSVGPGHRDWVVQQLVSVPLDVRDAGTWSRVYDEIIVGDWSAGGDLDEMILVGPPHRALAAAFSWAGFRPTSGDGYWSTGDRRRRAWRLRHRRPGRRPVPVRRNNGRWTIWSFHRNVPSPAPRDWLHGYDVISVGSFMD